MAEDRPAAIYHRSLSGDLGLKMPPGRWQGATLISGLLLLAAVSAGAFGEGDFDTSGQRAVAMLLAAAMVAALVGRRPAAADLRLAPVPVLAALAVWALLDGAITHAPRASDGYVLVLVGMAAMVLVGRRLDTMTRHLLLDALPAVGLLVAASGWLGVVARQDSWAAPADGLWRAASVLTYANTTAALLVLLALVTLGQLVDRPRSLGRVMVATGLLVGAGATLSRAGAASFLVGLVLLAVLAGVRVTLRAVTGPVVGAMVAWAGLVPSMPTGRPAQPWVAVCCLAAGFGLAAGLARLPRLALVAVAVTVGLAGALLIASGRPAMVDNAAAQIVDSRATLASPDRSGATGAAWRRFTARPLTGIGPGRDVLRWVGRDGKLRLGVYAHNEYLQVLSDLGLPGAVLLVAVLATLARLAWSARPPTSPPMPLCSARSLPAGLSAASSPAGVSHTAWAGTTAALGGLAIHSGFDFVWHAPVIPLTAAALLGLLISMNPSAGTTTADQPSSSSPQGKEWSACNAD